MKTRYSVALVIVCLATSMASAADLKPQEIISRHLDAVASKEKRDGITSLMAIGASEFESTTPQIKGGGRAVVVSNPDNLFFVMSLNSKEYPFEKIGYFSGKLSIPFVSPGMRSLLGAFIADHEKILSDGLFGGVLSLRWPMLETGKPRGKFSFAGTKKVDGEKFHVMDFNVSGGGSPEFTIQVFFDAETFHHVRTEYKYEVFPRDAVFGQQNRRASGRLFVTERFSEFKNVDGYNFPHVYRIDFESNGNTGAQRNSWGIRVDKWSINQKLAPDFFTFDAK